MYSFVYPAYLQERALFYGESLPSGDLYVALSTSSFSVTNLMAQTVSAVTSLAEGSWSGYARQKLIGSGPSGKPQTVQDSGLRVWKLLANTSHFGVLGAGPAVNFALIYLGSTASPSGDSTALPLYIVDNNDTHGFPFTPDGVKPVNIRWSASGVAYGPNCQAVTARALTMEDSLFLAETVG